MGGRVPLSAQIIMYKGTNAGMSVYKVNAC